MIVYKVKRFKSSSCNCCNAVFFITFRTFAALQVLLDILLLTWGASEDYEIVVKTLNSGYSIWINFFVLCRSGHFHNVVLMFTYVVKTDVENKLCLCQRWNTQRWFDVVRRCKFQHWNTQRCFNADRTLSHVATSRQPKDNVETTLKCLLGPYLSWQSTYPNLKTTRHIKLEFFFWTKLLENLLLAKYLIYVTAPLNSLKFFNFNSMCCK